MLVSTKVNNPTCPIPFPQDLSQQARDLQHKMEDLSAKMAHRKKLEEKNLELQLQQRQREGSQAEKLLEHEQEVGPTVHTS